jgi:hypothetical protein
MIAGDTLRNVRGHKTKFENHIRPLFNRRMLGLGDFALLQRFKIDPITTDKNGASIKGDSDDFKIELTIRRKDNRPIKIDDAEDAYRLVHKPVARSGKLRPRHAVPVAGEDHSPRDALRLNCALALADGSGNSNGNSVADRVCFFDL